jgi:hypothetical protein
MHRVSVISKNRRQCKAKEFMCSRRG